MPVGETAGQIAAAPIFAAVVTFVFQKDKNATQGSETPIPVPVSLPTRRNPKLARRARRVRRPKGQVRGVQRVEVFVFRMSAPGTRPSLLVLL